MRSLDEVIIGLPVLLLALTLHEYAHGYVAYRLGDPTAKQEGRLTFNPIKHLDPIGTLAFLFLPFGWAKPVPVNAAYFQNPRLGMLWVAIAGPATNFALAFISAIFLHLLYSVAPLLSGAPGFTFVAAPLSFILFTSFLVNILLCVFNLLPIPPLDGSRIVSGLLPENLARTYDSFERYGFIILLVLLMTGGLGAIITPLMGVAAMFLPI
jgi:Zn-dependent protease